VKVDPFIEAEKLADRSVNHACCLLEVSRAAYYQRRNGEPSKREVTDAELTEKITAVHAESKGTYGSPRVHQVLRQQGFCCGKRRVARLMRGAGLEGRCKKRWRKTTVVDPDAERARDLIQRHFGPCTEIDRRYVGDITYIATWQGWAYLATVIDLASRRVVGWALAEHMRTELVEDALSMAFLTRRPPKGVIFHSDRGCQYTSKDFADLAREKRAVLSVGRKGECWDKAMVSYCTPCRWLGGRSFVEADSLPFGVAEVAWGGWVEETDVLVVGLVGGDQAGALPGFDGGWVHVDPVGKFGDGEQSLGSESFEVAGQAVAAA
jgi:transposase InsO family protein